MYIYTHWCMAIYMYGYLHVWLSTCTYTHIDVWLFTCTWILKYICTYTCTHTCTCTCTCRVWIKIVKGGKSCILNILGGLHVFCAVLCTPTACGSGNMLQRNIDPLRSFLVHLHEWTTSLFDVCLNMCLSHVHVHVCIIHCS